MLTGVLYATAEYSSLEKLEGSLSSLRVVESYAMATRTPVQLSPFSSKVVLKFHFLNGKDEPSIDALAQVEFEDVGVEQKAIIDGYQQTFWDRGLGRISLVPKGLMTHNVAAQISLLANSLDLSRQLTEALAAGISGREGYGMLSELAQRAQGLLYDLTDARAINGFNLSENTNYGMLLAAHNLASASYLQGIIEDEEADKTRVSDIKEMARLYIAEMLALSEECTNEIEHGGPNRPVVLKKIGVADLV